jgi:hypothetical protein
MIRCPRCRALLMPGPRGGSAQNFYCYNRASCRQGFNLVVRDGVIVWRQDIGEVDDERFRMYAVQRH